MDITNTVLFDLITIILVIVVLLLLILQWFAIRSTLAEYFQKRDQDTATKDDLGDLIGKIDDLRVRFVSEIEALRAQLDQPPPPTEVTITPPPVEEGAIGLRDARYERDYQVLSDLWDVLYDYRRATLDLGLYLEDTPAEGKVTPTRETRLRIFAQSKNALSELLHRQMPFYPSEIYTATLDLLNIGGDRETDPDLEISQTGEQDHILAYWESTGKRGAEILEGIEIVSELIRKRIAD
jgi:hypothetical protein